MLRIGDFSKLTQVSVRMLRYYDKHGLLKPAYIDPVTGYRMYMSEQVPRLQKIILLRDLDFGVAEIAQLLQNEDKDCLTRSLREKISSIEANIAAEKERIARIGEAAEHIRSDRFDQYYNVTLKTVPACRVVPCADRYPAISTRAGCGRSS